MRTVAAILLVSLAAACSVRQAEADPTRTPIKQTTGVRVFIDPDTGCHYLAYVEGGITPRLTADGKPLCFL